MNVASVLAPLPLDSNVNHKLAAKITTPLAVKFSRACAERAIGECAKCEGIVRYLFYSGGSLEQAEEWTRSIHQEELRIRPQATGVNAGRRISDAFQAVFAEGASAAVVLCQDVPDVDASLISNSFAALKSHDVIFGPTHAGSYYLVGIKSHQPSLFEGIPWGTEKVLNVSVSKAKTLGLIVAPSESLPLLNDIDRFQSFVEWTESPSMTDNPLRGLATEILDENRRLRDALSETGYSLISP